ncbi:hypothetical protein, partial [Nitrosococcus oceani]|uniref:hypothetical protein n=1 Tax=Nitrosococcus oceani TaxID=1229 RepID=UPI001E339ED5
IIDLAIIPGRENEHRKFKYFLMLAPHDDGARERETILTLPEFYRLNRQNPLKSGAHPYSH